MIFDALQIDLFGDLAGFIKNAEAPKSEVQKTVTQSSDGIVTFRYAERLRKSIRCKKHRFENRYELTLPGYMKSEEFFPVRELAANWAKLIFKRKTDGIKAQTHELLSRIWKATDQILADMGKTPVMNNARFPTIRPVGKHFDLNKIFDQVNAAYFQGELQAKITWSSRVGGLSFHTIRKDPLTGETQNLISISRGYDFENCPLYAVAGVVYHECLHIAIPPVVVNGRRIVHGRVFRQRERRYLYYEQWIKWHKTVLPKNILMLRREKGNFW